MRRPQSVLAEPRKERPEGRAGRAGRRGVGGGVAVRAAVALLSQSLLAGRVADEFATTVAAPAITLASQRHTAARLGAEGAWGRGPKPQPSRAAPKKFFC